MGKIWCGFLGGGVLFFLSTISHQPLTALAAEKPKKVSPVEQAQKAQAAEREEAAVKLNGTEWAIEVHPLSGEKPKRPKKDTLRFEGGKVASEEMTKEGFPPTNYTLTVGDDGSIVWETMQTKEEAGVAFWRGELQGETMRGILSKHPSKGDPVDFSFQGKKSQTAPAPEVAPAAPAVSPPADTSGSMKAPAVPVAAAEEEEAPEPPRAKKKGWW